MLERNETSQLIASRNPNLGAHSGVALKLRFRLARITSQFAERDHSKFINLKKKLSAMVVLMRPALALLCLSCLKDEDEEKIIKIVLCILIIMMQEKMFKGSY